jgi:hypothetical protein
VEGVRRVLPEKGIPELVDFARNETKSPPLIPADIARHIPPRQYEHAMRYYGAYAEAIDNLCRIAVAIPRIGGAENTAEPIVYLHYYTDTEDYFIYEYDGKDTMSGTARSAVFSDGTTRQKISLANLFKNEYIKLDFSWECQTSEKGD